jgi:hypothetical protein
MKTIECACGAVEDVDDDSLRTECFKHHIRGVTFNFVAVTTGRSAFNEQTVREAQQEIERGAAANGIEVEPVGKRWV